MSDDETMDVDERYKYLRGMKRRYVRAGRKERGQLLDEMMAVTGSASKNVDTPDGGNAGTTGEAATAREVVRKGG